MLKSLISGAVLLMTAAASYAAPAEVVRELAPSGRLRAAINFGNLVLAQKDPATGEARGVSVDLAREIGKRLGVPVDLVPFEGAGRVVAAATQNAWDVAFLAIDPVRGQELAYTAPYVLIEGTYLTLDGSRLRTVEEVDAPGIRIGVSEGSAYDLYLTRSIKQAQLVRERSLADTVAALAAGRIDVVAGVRQALEAAANERSGVRVFPGRFMAIEQAVATRHGREAGLAFLKGLVEEAKGSGFVAEALARSGQTSASVAPAAK
jgi:polar amino acid transport system substrate-binding protein